MGSRDHHSRLSTGDTRLRERYDELRVLRETQPERESAACKEMMQKSKAASDKLIASLREQLAAAQQGKQQPPANDNEEALTTLRAENAQLRRQLETANAAAASAAAAAPAAAAAASTAPNVALEGKLAFYELMTGMRCELSGDIAKCKVVCAVPMDDDEDAAPTPCSSAPVKTHSALFELNLKPPDGEEGVDVEYVPTDLSGCDDGALPEYLREPIVFERQQAPGFLRRLLSGVASD